MIVTQFAAKQIQRLQIMKCFYFIHSLVQKWKPAEIKEEQQMLAVRGKEEKDPRSFLVAARLTCFVNTVIQVPCFHMHHRITAGLLKKFLGLRIHDFPQLLQKVYHLFAQGSQSESLHDEYCQLQTTK